jgi:Tfp pilus assembly protein PilZ
MAPGKRKYDRDIASLIICYSISDHNSEKLWTAMMEDYSHTGLRMVTTHPLEEGQEILIKSALLEEPRLGVVRWTKINGDALYRVGLEFKR